MFNSLLQFKGTFRKYQQEVLDEFDAHYEDNCIHIVAPPGSGKTILGIELLRKVNKKTLVLVPTIALRTQWIDRIMSHFAVENSRDFISTDINIDAPLTIDTYQGFYSRCKQSDGAYSEEFDYDCLVLDEAHHLKSSWYGSLINIIEDKQVSTISLTATPPYDSVRDDWDKYEKLNGMIDVVISVPVLVDENNLCPHQDLIYLTTPTKEERDKLKIRIKSIDSAFNAIAENTYFLDYLYNLDFIQSPNDHESEIFDKIDIYIPVVKMLTNAEYKLSKQVYRIIGVTNKLMRAKVTSQHIAVVVNEYVLKDFKYKSNYTDLQSELLDEIIKLREHGLINKKQIDIDAIYDDCGIIAKSLSKIDAVNTIINTEIKSKYEPMKAVVLCDFINDPYDDKYNAKIFGTFDLFNSIITNTKASAAMICGKYLIVSKENSYLLNDMLGRDLAFEEYENNDYSLLRIADSFKSRIVNSVTKLLKHGNINTLVGTQSLLGEGWDCQSINTLIIASNVKTFVTSNQVRGRSFRINPDFEKKVANIWHLCAIDVDGIYRDDMNVMLSRFETFVGLSKENDNCTLDSGLKRFDVINELNSTLMYSSSKAIKNASIHDVNRFMIKTSKKRAELYKEWQKALKNGSKLDWVYSVSNFYDENHPNKTVKQAIITNLIYIAGYVFTMYLSIYFRLFSRVRINSVEDLKVFLIVFSIFFVFIVILPNWRLYWYAILNRRRDKQLNSFSKAVFYAMLELDLFKDNSKNITKRPVLYNMKFYTKVVVDGLSIQDQQLFTDAIYELNTYDWNMRYLLKVRRGFKASYFPVPKLLGERKSSVEVFIKQLQHEGVRAKAKYIRNAEGRKIVTKLRIKEAYIYKNKEYIQKKSYLWH